MNGTAAEPVAGPKTKNATSANATVPAASVNGTATEPVAGPATENATSVDESPGNATASLAGNAARQTSSAVTLATDSTGLVGASVSSALSDEIFDARLRAMFAEAKGRYEAAADRTRHESLERYVQSATRPSGRSDAAAAASAEASLGRKARAGSFSSTLGAVEVAEASAKEREMGLRRVSRAQDVCTRPLGAAHSGRSGLSDVIKRQLFEIHFKHESGLAAEEDANVAAAAAAGMGRREPRAASFPVEPIAFQNSDADYGETGATYRVLDAAEARAVERADRGAKGSEKARRRTGPKARRVHNCTIRIVGGGDAGVRTRRRDERATMVTMNTRTRSFCARRRIHLIRTHTHAPLRARVSLAISSIR